MRVSASLVGIAVIFGVLGCQGGDEATTSVARDTTTVVVTTGPPEQIRLTPEERLLQWIRSCEVRRVILTHEGVALITFGHGGTLGLRINEDAEARVEQVAFRQSCRGFKRVIVGIQ